ncbi:MAG: DNA polymerase III subunit [Bacteroidales bacterium]
MLFSQVKGQKILVRRIISLVDNNHFPHAILLNGKDGYGNLTLALATAQYISCTKKLTGENSCSICSSCNKYEKLIHPDLHFIFPNTATKRVDKNNDASLFITDFRKFVLEHEGYCSLNRWYNYIGSENRQGIINVRDANNIISALTMKTYESKFKIMIIWNADRMNNEASDKILKILEEPYPNTVFILTTEHKDKIMPTILSRVQHINVPPLDDNTMYNAIKEYNPNLNDEQILIKIALCEGNYNRISELDSKDETNKVENFIEINRLAMMYRKNAKDIVTFVDVFSRNTREQLKSFLDYFLRIVEKCWIYNNNVKSTIHPLEQMDNKFKNNFPKFITENNIEGICKVIEQAYRNIDHNANTKINLFDMIIKLGYQLEKR